MTGLTPTDQPLAGAYVALISDALDRLGLRDQVLDPAVRPLFPGASLAGRAATAIAAPSDRDPASPYEGEMAAAAALRDGDIAVIAVRGATRAALWGELFSCAARGRGAVGALVDGHVRDSRQIAELAFPVFCRGRSPLDTLRRAEVTNHGGEVVCGGVPIRPGDLVVGDEDGVVVVPSEAVADVATAIEDKMRKESSARRDLLDGHSLQEVWSRYGVL